jgi:hypothetical protein
MNGKIKIIPMNEGYTAVKFQGYDKNGEEIPDAQETAITQSPTSAASALRMVREQMSEAGYPTPEPPTDVEEYKGETDDRRNYGNPTGDSEFPSGC